MVPRRTGDIWFDRNHVKNLTPEFWDWWVTYYDPVETVSDHSDGSERHEYWTRCAFALMGWRARAAAL